MPNHTANTLTVKTDDKKLLGTIKNTLASKNDNGEIQAIDFNKIIPMPEELIGTSSPPQIVGTEQEKERIIKENKERFQGQSFSIGRPITQVESVKLNEKYGADNWYDWAVENWDTKWNAYSVGKWKGNRLYFETAWAPPLKVIQKLSSMFPEATFSIHYVDEGGAFDNTSTFVGGY